MKLSTSFLFFFSISIFSFSQENSWDLILPDRPTDSYGPGTVPKKALQIESGFGGTSGSESEAWSTTSTDLLLRYGLFERIELRVSSNFASFNTKISVFTGAKSKLQYPTYGIKFNLVHEKGIIPEIGILTTHHIDFQTVNDEKNIYYNFDAVLAFSNTLSKHISLGYNFIPQTGSFTVVLGYGLEFNLDFFTELHVISAKYKHQYYKFNSGLTFQPLPAMILDLSLQTFSGSRDKFLSVGLSILLNSNK
ncbi:MAG: transporter [Flavobacteriales bacterium]|nr:transporter [Flavobacteriales bacterium]